MARYYLLVAGILILCVLIATGCGEDFPPPTPVEDGRDCLADGGFPIYQGEHFVGCYFGDVPE